MEDCAMKLETLNEEAETYERRKAELVKQNEGRFVLISGSRVVSIWDTYEDAVNAGYREIGINTPFFVKQISAVERVQFISREVVPCQS
jgi:hypothetical protein